jgi:protein tyrosine phosphatase
MLTKRYEGSSVKCETYWPTELHSERQFGHYVVKATSSSMAASEQDAARPANEGFDFGQAATEPSGNDIAKRTFLLTNLLQPEAPARDITHFQYLEWPDLGVPIDPEGFLNLIDQVNQASEHAQDAPTILHCSAGVGRTGGYILVDAVLDGIRRAMRIERADLSSQESAVEMDVDETSSPEERPFLQPRKRLPSAPAASAPSSARPVFPSQRAVLPESSSWPTSSIPVPRSSSPRKTKRPMVSRRRISERIKARDGAIDPSSLSGISSEESHADTQDRSSFGASASASLSSGQSGQSDPSTPSTVPTSVPGTPPQRKTNPLTAPAFDFMPPRTPQHELNPLLPLQTMSEPVRQVLEGMREQRMSLCQTLRQYVFAHTAIIQGAVRMLDEPEFSSRGSSDTTLDTPMEGINLSKRPSTKRRHRSDSSPEEFPSKSVVHHRAVGFSRDMEDYM